MPEEYSPVLKKNIEPTNVLIVKRKNRSQSSKVTCKELKTMIDPVALSMSVNKLVEKDNGTVVNKCNPQDNIKSLETNLKSRFGTEYTVGASEKLNPKVIIFSVNKEDTLDKEKLLDTIVKQNRINVTKNFVFKIIRAFGKKDTDNIIMGCDPNTFKALLEKKTLYIRWNRCRVVESFHLLRCYNCCTYGHRAKNCRSSISCPKCSGDHALKDCSSTEFKCINCDRYNTKFKSTYLTSHNVFDKSCPVYINAATQAPSTTNYSSQQLPLQEKELPNNFIFLLNVQSLNNKINMLDYILQLYPSNFICLTETWLKPAQISVTHLSNYKLVSHFSRTQYNGGGSCIFVGNKFNATNFDVSSSGIEKLLEVCAVQWFHNSRRCRVGCQRTESLSHVLQGCPVTHALRLKRHDEIVNKIATHSRRRGYTVEKEPRVYHPDRQLLVPDLAIHLPDDALLVCDVQVCSEGSRNLVESWERKRLVYDNPRFRAAAARRWLLKRLTILPLLLSARGMWPRCNARTAELLALPNITKARCVHSRLKWGSLGTQAPGVRQPQIPCGRRPSLAAEEADHPAPTAECERNLAQVQRTNC
ncbi:hypothetical protein QE152_g29022 [Popillia japonica]|uniref:CCHC-type domain-containing protein n=1 Tax=Popillia japonica TaxID=7064 RepID=A0AAW1JKJ7_POPJA